MDNKSFFGQKTRNMMLTKETFSKPDKLLVVQLNALLELTINCFSCRVRFKVLEPVKLANRAAHRSIVAISKVSDQPCRLKSAHKTSALACGSHISSLMISKAKWYDDCL